MYDPNGDEDQQSSVFYILEQACLELANLSYSYRVQNTDTANAPMLDDKSRPLYKNFIYSRMLWGKVLIIPFDYRCSNLVLNVLVSMAMKFHDAHETHITCMTKSLWREKLVNFHHRIVFQTDAINSLKQGLELGTLLKLPSDLSFHHEHLGDLLARETLRPFSHLALVMELGC